MNLLLRQADEQRHDVRLVKKPTIHAAAVIAATILAIAIPVHAEASTSQHPPRLPRVTAQAVTQEDLLWWLPPDTESVVAARGPFPLPIGPSDDEENDQEWFSRKATQAEIHVAFEQLPFELFYGLELETPLRGSIVAFAMQGSRHFRDPLPGLEVMDFEGCSIIVFESESSGQVSSLVPTLAKKANRTEVVAGTRVLVFREKSGDAERSLFLAAPRPNVLLVANNLPYLQEVLERMAQRTTPRALPDQLPEWRFLDPAVRFWGLRHYDRTQAKEDATSPFSEVRTFGPGDEKAIGILFTLDPNNQQEAVITDFSGNEAIARDAARAGRITSEPQEGVKFEIKLRNPKAGVLEQVYTLDRSSTLDYFILTVTIALGRGMYF